MSEIGSLRSRLVAFIRHEGLSIRAFESSIGVSNGYVKNIKDSIGSDKLTKLFAAYPTLNPQWLLLGEGDMVRPAARRMAETSPLVPAGIGPKEFRKRYGLTQKELAELLGVSIRAVQNYEAGRAQIRGRKRRAMDEYVRTHPAPAPPSPPAYPSSQQARMKYLLELYSVTPYRLCKETGVSQSSLSRFFNDPTEGFTLKSDTIERIAAYFHASAEWLETGQGDAPDPSSPESFRPIRQSDDSPMDEKKLRAFEAVHWLISIGAAGSPGEIATRIGYGADYFSQMVSGSGVFPDRAAKKLAALSEELSLEWLLYGDGTMLKGAPASAPLSDPEQAGRQDDPQDPDLSNDVLDADAGADSADSSSGNAALSDGNVRDDGVSKDTGEARAPLSTAIPLDNPEIVYLPIVPYTARAGSLGDYEQLFDEDRNNRQPVLVTKQMHGKYLCFSVGGDSMEPVLLHGDVVMARHISPDLYRTARLHLRDWSVWIVVTHSDGILIKHIVDHDVERATLRLHSANPYYPDLTVPMSDVIDVYNVIEIVSRHL